MKRIVTKIAWATGVMVAMLTYSLPASAQQRTEIDVQQWPTGKVVLTSGDTIYGPLSFYRSEDVVNIKNSDGTISTFSPVNVQYFVAQDQPSGRSYLFRTLQWDMGRDYTGFKKPTFFEQLNQGPVTLMMRESYLSRPSNYTNGFYGQRYYYDPYFYPTTFQSSQVIKELYYVLLPNGEVVTLRHVRKDLHRLFGDKSREVKKYVRQHRLDYERPHELVAIINYFNSL